MDVAFLDSQIVSWHSCFAAAHDVPCCLSCWTHAWWTLTHGLQLMKQQVIQCTKGMQAVDICLTGCPVHTCQTSHNWCFQVKLLTQNSGCQAFCCHLSNSLRTL